MPPTSPDQESEEDDDVDTPFEWNMKGEKNIRKVRIPLKQSAATGRKNLIKNMKSVAGKKEADELRKVSACDLNSNRSEKRDKGKGSFETAPRNIKSLELISEDEDDSEATTVGNVLMNPIDEKKSLDRLLYIAKIMTESVNKRFNPK